MEKHSALPAWLLFLVITLAIACAVGAALLFTQLDSFQQRSLLPQATLPAIDQEATLSASDVTVVVIVPEQTAAAEPSSTPLPAATRSEPTAMVPSETPTSEPVCLATPDDWVAYTVQDQDTLASLALELGTTIVLLRQANCIEDIPIQPGQEIFIPALSGTADAGARRLQLAEIERSLQRILATMDSSSPWLARFQELAVAVKNTD